MNSGAPVKPDGTSLRQLTTGRGDSSSRWSPNGHQIALTETAFRGLRGKPSRS